MANLNEFSQLRKVINEQLDVSSPICPTPPIEVVVRAVRF